MCVTSSLSPHFFPLPHTRIFTPSSLTHVVRHFLPLTTFFPLPHTRIFRCCAYARRRCHACSLTAVLAAQAFPFRTCRCCACARRCCHACSLTAVLAAQAFSFRTCRCCACARRRCHACSLTAVLAARVFSFSPFSKSLSRRAPPSGQACLQSLSS